MKRFNGLYVVLVMLLTMSCSKVPSGVISPKDMAEILADIDIGEAVVESDMATYRDDSVRRALRQSIYLSHGYTPEEVDSSLAWYARNVKIYSEVSEEVTKILEERIRKTREAGALVQQDKKAGFSVSTDGDSVDVWTLGRYLRFTKEAPSRIFNFAFDHDRNWDLGDIYELRFKIVTTPGNSPVDVTIAADYNGGRGTDYIYERLRDGYATVRLNLDTLNTPSSLYGSIACHSPKGYAGVTIDSIALVRMHNKPGRRKPNPKQLHHNRNY